MIKASITGKCRFTFAVIADTHVNQKEDYSSSPYPANALANARTRRVIAELNRHDPAFVIHLGDIVNPVPELPTYEAAAGHFKAQVAELKPPLHLVPGNHDVGDKPVSWMPAGTVADEHLALYERNFGKHFFAFHHEDLHFVVVNAPIINSGLAAEAQQEAWLEAELAAHANRRTFIAIHYPPYVSNPDERGSYDNLDEPGRSWLMDLVRAYKPEAMFCGHVHNFWYDLLGDTEMYLLPSTAFVRHDYSELYRIGPGDQYGRNDGPKLGYFLVRVYEQGHVVENIRSYGRTLAPGVAQPVPVRQIARPQPKEATLGWLGLDLRQPWCEELEVTPSGAVDEFERKRTRNDYPVLALWEMGLKRLRVPIQDLADPRVRQRMAVMIRAGHLFQVHCYGLPTGPDLTALRARPYLVDTLEIVINWDRAATLLPQIAALTRQIGRPVLLSRVNRKDAGKHAGGRYNHLISHGFTLAEADELAAFFATDSPDSAMVAGVMFTLPRDTAPATAVEKAQAFAARIGKQACFYVRSTGPSPAESFEDETANAARFAEAVMAAAGAANISVILDTFADADRGYFARTGLVDRRYNPKLGSHVIGNLIGALDGADWRLAQVACGPQGQTRGILLEGGAGQRLALVMPKDGELCHPSTVMAIAEGMVEVADLATGVIRPLADPMELEDSGRLQLLASGALSACLRSGD